jgi:hypothetical protein
MDTIPVENSVDQSQAVAKKEEFAEKVVEEVVQKEVDVKVGAHLKEPSELKGFPIFPDGTKSLLKKYLTKDIWNELKDAKDSHGFIFK